MYIVEKRIQVCFKKGEEWTKSTLYFSCCNIHIANALEIWTRFIPLYALSQLQYKWVCFKRIVQTGITDRYFFVSFIYVHISARFWHLKTHCYSVIKLAPLGTGTKTHTVDFDIISMCTSILIISGLGNVLLLQCYLKDDKWNTIFSLDSNHDNIYVMELSMGHALYPSSLHITTVVYTIRPNWHSLLYWIVHADVTYDCFEVYHWTPASALWLTYNSKMHILWCFHSLPTMIIICRIALCIHWQKDPCLVQAQSFQSNVKCI